MSRIASILTVCLVGLLAGASGAAAGTYTVDACGAAGGINMSWTQESTTTLLEVENTCAGGGDTDPISDFRGALYVRDRTLGGGAGGNLPGYSNARWRFDAPLGARLIGLKYTRHLETDQAPSWRVATETDDGELEGCQGGVGGGGCGVGGYGGLDSGSIYVTMNPLDTQWIRFGIRCTAASCPAGGGSIHDARAIIYAARVHVEENTLPGVAAPAGAIVSGASFSTGQVAVEASASDNLGIEALEVLVDGAVAASQDYACDGRLVRPCAAEGASRTAQLAVNVSSLAVGPHTVQIRGRDGAGNEAVGSASSFTVAREAPPTTPPGGGEQPPPVPPIVTPVPTPPTAPDPGPGTGQQPGGGGGGTPVVLQARLTAVKGRTLSSGAARITGKLPAGCGKRVTVRVSGKTSKGKTRTRTASVSPRRSGAWTVQVKRPSGVPRKARLKARVRATTTSTCSAPRTVTKTIAK